MDKQHDARFLVSNCLVGCETITKLDNGWIRDRTDLSLGGFDLTLRQREEVVNNKLDGIEGVWSHTTDIIVLNISRKQLPQARKVVEGICWLLGFACLSPIDPFGCEYPSGSGMISRRSSRGIGRAWRPTIQVRDGKTVRQFLQTTYPAYRRLQRRRKLNVVFDYLIHAERESEPTELRLLLSHIALECLKDTFAKISGYPFRNGYYRKVPRPRVGGDRYTFEELLTEMLASVGMRHGIKRIIAIRNELIHSGTVRRNPSSRFHAYERCHDLLREYLLRLLRYEGPYVEYRGGGRGIRNLP